MAMAKQNDMEREFEPGCWRYVTVKDFKDQMTEEEYTRSGLRGQAENMLVAKLQWSRQACAIMHGQLPVHVTPYQGPESQQEVASPDWESDSEATIAYDGESEGSTSTSLITSTCDEDASGPEDVEEESDDDGDELEPVYYPVDLGG